MKKHILKFSWIINHNYFIRVLVMPIMIIKRRIEQAMFCKSSDADYIRTFNNIYYGDCCFVIGNGPSLTISDLELIRNYKSFACNRIFNLYKDTSWRPTFYMCGDRQVLFEEIDRIKVMDGSIKFVATFAKKYGRKRIDNLHYFLISGPFEPHEEKKIQKTVQEDVSRFFSVSQSIVCSAIELAIYMGFKNIFLIGVDHNYPISIDRDGNKTIDSSVKAHFEGGGSKQSSLNYIYYDAQTECYKNIKKYADSHDINIYNATRGGKLDVFERKQLEELLMGLK